MKRLNLCISILVVIIILSICSLLILKKSNEKLCELVDKTSEAYENNLDAEEYLDELQDYWKKYYTRISYVADSDLLNDISRSVSRLPVLLKQNSDDFLTELAAVRNCAALIFNSQFPYIYAIF
ncbi:MAG: DUF4363 family protein [Hominimerdicola sp.]